MRILILIVALHLLHECRFDICHETVRFWWNRFGPMFAAEIQKTADQSDGVQLVAVAPRRDVREDQR